MTMSASLKEHKNTLVAALFELTKAADAAANATVDFYNEAQKDGVVDSVVIARDMYDAFQALTGTGVSLKNATNAFAETAKPIEEDAIVEPAKKKKRIVDPHAPKKPHTMYLAFSSYCRTILKSLREKCELPPLNSSEMTREISERWNSLPESEKAKWKTAYDEQMAIYSQEKEKYAQLKAEGQMIDMSGITHFYSVDTGIVPFTKDEFPVETQEKDKDKEEKLKEIKKEKKDKKEKKKEKKDKKKKKEKKEN